MYYIQVSNSESIVLNSTFPRVSYRSGDFPTSRSPNDSLLYSLGFPDSTLTNTLLPKTNSLIISKIF